MVVTINKYVIIGTVSAALLLSAGGLFWYTKSSETKKTAAETVKPYTLGKSTESNESQDSSSAPQLNVNQIPQGTDLGQLDTTNGQQNAPADSSAEKQTNPFDPATFKQYDKYKDATAGLFAEVQKGTGAELTNGKKAAVYYKGWLTDGQLFDQSQKDDKGTLQPFVFEMGAQKVIPGWEQALTGMKVGGVRLVIVPPSVGYGAAGQGSIPGNAVLIFQVQLAAVE